MKKTELQRELDKTNDYVRRLENIIYGVKTILWDRSSYQHKIDDVLPEIKKRYESTIKAEGEVKGFDRKLEGENRWLKETLELLIVPEGKLEQLTKIVEERRRKQGIY